MTTIRFPIEAGHIMTFARAVSDPNPVYHDAGSAQAVACGGVIAPPTFLAANAQYDPDYALRPRIGQPWKGSGKNPSGTPDAITAATGLHAEQHFEYHAPVRAGDVLSGTPAVGRVWEKAGRRGGTMQFRELVTEWRNQNGELAVTTRKVTVTTSQTVKQD